MPNEPVGELPGDVLIALRKSKGFIKSAKSFADTLPMSYDTLQRLEKVKWGTIEEKWERPVERTDLDSLVAAEWIEKGDEWWQRFETAFAWQYAVMEFGARIYKDSNIIVQVYEPIHIEHVIALVRVLVTREVQKLATGGKPVSADTLSALIDKVTGEVLARLAMQNTLITRKDMKNTKPPEEKRRDLAALFAPSQPGTAEDPYVRTLRMAYAWAEEAAQREVGKL